MKNILRSFLALSFLFAAQVVAKAEEVFLQSVQSGKYVTVVNGTLAAAAPDVGRASRFVRIPLEGNRMAFRDTGGSFVRAGVGPRSHLAAVSDQASGWEIFRFIDVLDAPQAPTQSASLNLGDVVGTYRITHIAADNGFLVQLGRSFGTAAQFVLDNRGIVGATIGCNSHSVRISVRDGRVRTDGRVMQTKMMCSGQGQMAAEDGLRRALATTRILVRDGRTVTFKSATGADLMKIRRM
ncbi:META domain-containing protein [Hoeflea sp. AS60]|uniref:META domain-containing protein n=1 Tax=Hoeflea sp. AS60 TaxID=3135780 RepID=UPI00317780CD